MESDREAEGRKRRWKVCVSSQHVAQLCVSAGCVFDASVQQTGRFIPATLRTSPTPEAL